MAIRVDSTAELSQFLDTVDGRYAVLREERNADGPLELNLLADNAVTSALRARFPRRRNGIKIDVYGVADGDYHGFPHLPVELGERCLAGRLRRDGLYWPAPLDEVSALLYHAAYHKPVQSGIPMDDGEDGQGRYSVAIAKGAAAAGICVPQNLIGINDWLTQRGLGLEYARACAYVQHDFRYHRKSLFHAWLMNRFAGELNLYVVRATAVRAGLADVLIAKIAEQYEIWNTKKVTLSQRLTRVRQMRGGKWRRGGTPRFAVVVFDPDPIPSSAAERTVHPHVFNARQFIKVQWRQWFSEASGRPEKDNPIHSTDNEAEAVGHLPLFFDRTEQQSILTRLAARRRTAHCSAQIV